VSLVVVTKGRSAEEIQPLLASGQEALGESKVQEALPKIEALGPGPRWHLVGHLQRNKVKFCRPFSLIHSVDSVRLAQALSDWAERNGHVFEILVEINVSGEASKHGASAVEAGALVDQARDLPALEVRGLMTMAPMEGDPLEVRRIFRRLARLRDTFRVVECSMGMSDDFEVAVEEGATIVRIGRAIFE
jgi:pyridoxal phosphate enzyme (YggS family)